MRNSSTVARSSQPARLQPGRHRLVGAAAGERARAPPSGSWIQSGSVKWLSVSITSQAARAGAAEDLRGSAAPRAGSPARSSLRSSPRATRVPVSIRAVERGKIRLHSIPSRIALLCELVARPVESARHVRQKPGPARDAVAADHAVARSARGSVVNAHQSLRRSTLRGRAARLDLEARDGGAPEEAARERASPRWPWRPWRRAARPSRGRAGRSAGSRQAD